MRRIPARLTHKAALPLLALLVAACGGKDDGSVGQGPERTTTTSTSGSTTTVAGRTTVPGTTLPGGDLRRCESPEGFAIAAPATWSTNKGDVVAPCTQFNPEPFEVPKGTDERVAAIVAYVDRVGFADVSRPRQGRTEDRAVTVVDGRQAVRLAYRSSGTGLYSPGTEITQYLVDLTRQSGEAATLFVNTLGLPGFDYRRNVAVLDRMFQTLEVTDAAVATDTDIVATYLGGGGGFSVAAERTKAEVCLRIPPNGEPVCTDPPADDQVHTVNLRDLMRTVPSGVTGARVWRVDLVTSGGESHSYLPAPVRGMPGLGAYAFPGTVGAFDGSFSPTWVAGRSVRSRRAGPLSFGDTIVLVGDLGRWAPFPVPARPAIAADLRRTGRPRTASITLPVAAATGKERLAQLVRLDGRDRHGTWSLRRCR